MAAVEQKKTGIPVRFEITEQTRQAVDDYLRTTGKTSGEFLFGRHRRPGQCMSTRQYARLVSDWTRSIGLDPNPYLWRGQPWRLWVTDQPGGAGKTLFTLRFSATDGDGQP
jgi:integrase